MAVQYLANVKNNYGLWCYIVFALRSIWEIVKSVLGRPFKRRSFEVPEVSFAPTPFNNALVDRMLEAGALRRFVPIWWADGSHAQTFMMAALPPPKSHEYRREWLILPDRVQVRLHVVHVHVLAAIPPWPMCVHFFHACAFQRASPSATSSPAVAGRT